MSKSKGVITCCQQLVYITQWFTEMSEMQTQDFMKYLIQKYTKSGQQLDNQFINGFTQMGVSDRPASIFQCRMKLFSEWFPQWSDEEKQELLIRLRNIDSKFMDVFQSNLESNGITADDYPLTDDYQTTETLILNGNIDDDRKRTELVINGLSDDQKPEEIEEELKTDTVEEEVDPKIEAQLIEVIEEVETEEQPIESIAVQEVNDLPKNDEQTEVEEEEECLNKEMEEPVVNNETTNELEVCG